MKRFLIALVVAASLGGARGVQAQGYTVVVNAANPATSLSAATVADVFLKRSKSLGGRPVLPVDQVPGSAARAAFSKAVLGRNVGAVESFWQQQIFSGSNVPPAQKSGDAEVLAFVRANPTAIGYVSADAALGSGVKAVTVSP